MSANKWFDRVIFWTRERPTSRDWNQVQTAQAESMRILTKATFGEAYASLPTSTLPFAVYGYAPEGFLNDGFYVEPNASAGAMAIRLRPGYGLHAVAPTAVTDYGSASALNVQAVSPSPLVLSDYALFTVPASETAGNSRIDIIEVRADYTTTDSTTVGIFNALTEVFDPTAKNKTFTWDLLSRTGSVVSPASSTAPISYKKGVAFAGGIAGATEPATTPGYIKIARINLDGSVTTITQALIADRRRPLLAGGDVRISGRAAVNSTAASSTFDAANLPPGMIARFVISDAGVTGTTRKLDMYFLGGDMRPRNSTVPIVTVNPGTGASYPLTAHTTGGSFGTVDATLAAILSAGTGVQAVIGGFVTAPLGTPYALVSFYLADPALTAIPNPAAFNFNVHWSMG